MAVQGMQWPAVAQGPSASTDSYNRGGYKENSSSSSSSSSGQRDKVYVQNIPITMQQDSVEALFGKCGHVVDVKLLAPKDGRETVAGFIKFATEGAAEEAIDKMSGCVLGEGPPLRVMWPNSNRNNTQSDGRHGGSDRGSNQGFNRPNNYGNDSRRRQDRPMQSPFGMSSNGPVNHQQGSPFGANNPSNNNSYSQNSDKKSFMSILGRGENRNTGSSVVPGGLQSYGDNKPQGGHPPLAPLKTFPNYHNSVSQQNSYQNHQPGGGFQEPMSGQQQYNYQKQPHSNGYHQPPAPQQGQHFQEKAPRNYYQQPPAPQQHYHYQEQPSSDGYQQSQYHYQEQPSIDSYQQPPAPQQGQHFQEQNSSDSYQQPQYHYQEQPSTDSYQQPPAPQQGQHYQEQPSSDGYQHPPAPGQYHYQEQPSVQSFPTASNQEYQVHNSSQQYQSWGDSNTDNTKQNNSNFDRSDGPFGSTTANQSSWQPRSSDGQRSQGRDRTCHNCKEPGHFSRECPNPRVQGGQTCHKCGEVGHFSRECPNQSGPSGDQLCHKCGEAGHFARECSNAPSRGGGGSSCHKCGEEGHFARECPNAPSRGGGGIGSSCHKCGEEGHFARECSNAPNRDGTCHKCGEEGHFARECTVVNSNDSSRPAPVTYIPQELPEDMDALFRDIPHSGINFDKYDNIPVKATGHKGQDAPPPVNTFEEINFGSQTKTNIRRAGFVKPTPVQKYAFPIALAGQDLMACAQTGSGKTIAYLLPTLTSIINSGLPTATQSPLVICMAPTRELVVQIYKEAKKFADGTPVKVAVAYGGVSVAYQAGQIERGCHFLAATPGRLQDFVTREKVYLDGIKHLILDEADRMLDLGFGPAIRKLVQQCNMTPKEYRQTLMFSATFPNEIQLLAADFLKEDYFFLAVGCVGGTNLDIDQHVMRVNGSDKRNKLFDILNESGKDRTLVFVELKRVADFLACLLSENNFPTTSISSDRSQQEREAALKDFRNGRANILVATSVAARGLDIPDVKHVVNYDLPQDIDEYVHRIGRTGRIGNKGKATSFFEQGRDEKLARSMVKVLSDAFQEVPSWLEQAAEDAVGSSYGPAGGRFTSRDHREGGGRGRRRDDITNGMSNLNIQSEPSSNFGSKSYRQDTHSPSYTNTNLQNGPVDNHPPQGSHQERAPQRVARGGQGDSDDDWD